MLTLWHLVDPAGQSVRTCQAEHIQQAQFRLAPIARGYYVASDASYRTGWVAPPERVAPLRQPPKNAARAAAQARWVERNQERILAARVERNRRRRKQWNPEHNANQARVISGKQRQAIRDANIRRGLANIRAKREATTQ